MYRRMIEKIPNIKRNNNIFNKKIKMSSSVIDKATELEAGITNISSSESSENKIERADPN